MKDIPELFGSMVFNDQVMQERLPAETYQALMRTVENGRLTAKAGDGSSLLF